MAKSSSSDEWAFLNDDMGTPSEVKSLAEFALAAHEQEPVAGSRSLYTCSACGCEGLDEPPETQCHCYIDGAHWLESKVYTHPAPVPDVETLRIADALEGILWPNMAVGNKAVIKAAIEALRNKPAPVPAVPDIDTWRAAFEHSERQRDDGFNLHKCGEVYENYKTQERWESWLSSRAAMLNGGKS